MKLKFTYFLILIGITFQGMSQTPVSERIIFKHYTHNFGQLKYLEDAEYDFIFRNTSDSLLVLTNVKSKCGCTSTDWTRSPILKNKKGHIKITYDTSIIGRFSKSTYVYINGSSQPVKLIITGTVNPPKPDDPEYEHYQKKYFKH